MISARLVTCALAIHLLWSPPALAVVVLEETFDSSFANFASNSDWERSYCTDNWRTDLNGGVIANRDDGCEECGCNFLVQAGSGNPCIQSDPYDNHIQTGDKYWQNYVYSVTFRNADDDSMGVLFRYQNSATFYLFVLSRNMMPGGSGCDEEFEGARLIRMRPETGPVVLAESAGFTYTPETVHTIRVTAEHFHLRVEFDLNGDGAYGPDEVFFDQQDDAAVGIPAGRIGLYTYQNGVVESGGGTTPCTDMGCWFDDVVVDLLPPNDQGCEGLTWEGACDGNVLRYCDLNGKAQQDTCGQDQCCKWIASEQFYTCVPATQCGPGCADQCTAGETGCAANLTHEYACAQGDEDECLEPVFAACGPEAWCDPAVGHCVSSCTPDCTGHECGDDGCDGSCGTCDSGFECVDGSCAELVLGQLGDPCQQPLDCAEGLCVAAADQLLCSTACAGDAGCPEGYLCLEALVEEVPILACLPSEACVPDCAGKDCGTDGCLGTCGECVDGMTCKGGQCKATAGASCESADDCASGLCIHFQSGTFCSAPCSTPAACPDKWLCSPWLSATTPNICTPPSTMVAYEYCADVSECIDGCPSGSAHCAANCFFLGSDQAKSEYAALFVCGEESCQESCPDGGSDCLTACILESCFQEFAVCYPGSDTCHEALECVLDCAPGATSCIDDCYAEALPAAKKQLGTLLTCVTDQCPGNAPPACWDAAFDSACLEPFEGCTTQCIPICGADVCGQDGCGGTCGECPAGEVCKAGACTPDCQPTCDNLECGDDGCGGLCGECAQGLTCSDGLCVEAQVCTPEARQECVNGADLYWFDSCDEMGELAQTCPFGCSADQCLPDPDAPDVVPDGTVAPIPVGETVVFDAPTPDAGCTAARRAGHGAVLLILLALAGLALLRRRAHA